MIIQSLTLNNFRQYYGCQTIEFAHSNHQQVVTVILGENGRGKTGIYRAIMFALFGDIKLDQDSNEAVIYLGNIKAVEEKSKEGSGAHCSVTLRFTHRNEDYVVTRSYFSIKDAEGTQKEQLLETTLKNETSSKAWSTEKEIQSIIRVMIDERVKHYFFFDGERIERLTRVSAQQKEEVTIGIKNLLKIDQVLKSKDILSRLLWKVKKELEQHSTGEYKKALRMMSSLEKELQSLKSIALELDRQINEKDRRLADIDHTLQTYDPMKSDLNERERLEMQLDQVVQVIEQKFQQVKSLNKYLPLILGEDVFQHQAAKLSSRLVDGLEGDICSSFIQSLLTDLRCMCGTTFNRESSQYVELAALGRSVKQFEENKPLYQVQNELMQLTSYIEGRHEQLQQSVVELERLQSEKEQIQWKLEEINKRLTSSGEMEIQSLNKEREQLITDTLHIKHNLSLNQDEQREYDDKIANLNLQLIDLQQKSGLHKQLLTKHKILEDSVKVLTSIIKKFEANLIDELETATIQNLRYLLDQSGQSMMRKVQIQSEYTLEVLNTYDQPFLANISQGQRQVLSLSFIMALAQVAGGHGTLEMPLFMDTPFGRLSSQHQENLIEYLPQICSQWVLLVTDKEFGPTERIQFTEAGTLGRYYELVSHEAGVTFIKEVKPSIQR